MEHHGWVPSSLQPHPLFPLDSFLSSHVRLVLPAASYIQVLTVWIISDETNQTCVSASSNKSSSGASSSSSSSTNHVCYTTTMLAEK
jgi:hypothetical protein